MQTCIPNQREPELDAYHLSGLEVLDTELATFNDALTRKHCSLKRALTEPKLFSRIGNTYFRRSLHSARRP